MMIPPHQEPITFCLGAPPTSAQSSHLLIQDGNPSSSLCVHIPAGKKEERGEKSQTLPFRMPLRLHPMEQNLVLWSCAILKETDTGGSSFCYCLFHYGCWKKEGPVWRDSYLCVRFRAEGQKHHLDPEGISKWRSSDNGMWFEKIAS